MKPDHDKTCPGICAALRDCGSCTVQGQGAVNTSLTTVQGQGAVDTSLAGVWRNERCAWCVKEAQCQKITGWSLSLLGWLLSAVDTR